MQLNDVVTMFGADLQRRCGEKIHKISLHGLYYPNRDGTLDRGGFTFCNIASFSDEQQQFSIQEQIAQKIKKSIWPRYLAYFQAYTNTYAEVAILKQLYQQALNQANIVGFCVGTRSEDCVSQPVLDLLVEYQQQGYEIWLELGLQTCHDKTLKKINRGHNFASYQKIVQIARHKSLNVYVHLIIGLPGETTKHNLQTITHVINTGVDGIKLHPLNIVDGSIMAKAWQAGRLSSLELTNMYRLPAK